MNVLLPYDLEARRRLAVRESQHPVVNPPIRSTAGADAYATLTDGLAFELEPLINSELPIPPQKARLTRHGGRCPVHGTLLAFNPFSPHSHECAACRKAYTGREHDDWWAMGAQLWTAERAVHAAALYAVRGDPRHEALAIRILREYTQRYTSWPNKDNVLGPTRLFFSTYLESIWLLNVCHAVALLESTSSAWTDHDAIVTRQQIVAPSSAIISSYFEGRSNRQVWNEVAVLSAWRLLGDERQVRRRLRQSGGLCALIEHGLLDDGTWYEGENYHLFAHRGLWYGVQLMRAMEEELPTALNQKYSEGFVAPFLGVLPDDTFPSRRDSQYASSIRQWRTAEWCELGWAHAADPRLAGILARMYVASPTEVQHDLQMTDVECSSSSSAHERKHTGRATSTADAERNHPATQLTRADLSWRALLMGTETLPKAEPWRPGSAFLPSQGLAILRRDHGRTYAALEGGELGGGHGHPDQLALTLQTDSARWLQDPGTGSYTSPDLFWYRSTMAHFAPYVGDHSQLHNSARTRAFCDRGEFGWITKSVDQLAIDVNVQRSVVVADGYLIDIVDWETVSGNSVDFTLPIAGAATLVPSESTDTVAHWQDVSEHISAGVRDKGSTFFRETIERTVHGTLELHAHPLFAAREERTNTQTVDETAARQRETPGNGADAFVAYAASRPAVIRRSVVPGVPGQSATHQHRLVCHAASGTLVGVWVWPQTGEVDVRVVRIEEPTTAMVSVHVDVHTNAGRAHHHHTRVVDGWQIEITDATSAESRTVPAHRTVLLPPFTRDVGIPAGTIDTLANSAKSPSRERARENAILNIPCVTDNAIADLPGSIIEGAFTQVLESLHYVPTELSWTEAGSPMATIQLGASPTTFVVDVHAHTGPPIVSPLDAENPLDNERSAVNCDGLQWYMATAQAVSNSMLAESSRSAPPPRWASAAIHVPCDRSTSSTSGYVESLAGPTAFPSSTWRLMPDGWAIRLTWPRTDLPLNKAGEWGFELVVNECVPDRERRRGQLVLSGGGGYGYLAGDRRPVLGACIARLEPCAG